MDAAYCSFQLHEHCRSLGHVPLIDPNRRGGLKEAFEPADAIRYNERTVAERSNARLKDEFGANKVRVQGAPGSWAPDVGSAGAVGRSADAIATMSTPHQPSGCAMHRARQETVRAGT